MALRFRIGGSISLQKRSPVQGGAGTGRVVNPRAAARTSMPPRMWLRLQASSMTPEEFAKARRALMRRDPVLGRVIKKHRTRSPLDAPTLDPFPALVRTITAQQISTKAAAT